MLYVNKNNGDKLKYILKYMSVEEIQQLHDNYDYYLILLKKQYPVPLEDAPASYIKVLDDLRAQMNDTLNASRSKKQLRQNSKHYNTLYALFQSSPNIFRLNEIDIKPYALVREDLERKYKSAKNTRNTRGNGPMHRIHHVPNMTNSAMARYEKELNNERITHIKTESARQKKKKSKKTSKGTYNPLMNGSFNTKIKL